MQIILSINTLDKYLYDKNFQNAFPELKELFKKWGNAVANGINVLNTKLEILNSFEIDKLEKYFKTQVILKKPSSSIVQNKVEKIDCLENSLNNMVDFQNNVVISRNKDQIYLCFWR